MSKLGRRNATPPRRAGPASNVDKLTLCQANEVKLVLLRRGARKKRFRYGNKIKDSKENFGCCNQKLCRSNQKCFVDRTEHLLL